MKHAVPMVKRDGKTYLVVQTKDWNMERPLVGWTVPELFGKDAKNENSKEDDLILCDEDLQLFIVPKEKKEQYKLEFNYIHQIKNPRQFQIKEGSSFIWFLGDQSYNDILKKYRELKAKNQ